MTIFLEDKDITNKNNIHPAYRLIRDGNRQRIEAHNLCNALWEKYKKFSNHYFKKQLAMNFYIRYCLTKIQLLLRDLYCNQKVDYVMQTLMNKR